MANVTDRNNLAGLIPEPVSREIMQGTIAESAVLRMARRLPNMSSKTQTINVLDSLPTAYWVNGEVEDGTPAAEGTFKKTTNMAWANKKLYAEEIAVILILPEAVRDDSNYDIWAEAEPRLIEAFGQLIDHTVIYGDNKPATWRQGIVPSAAAAGNTLQATDNTFQDIMGVGGLISLVEEDGFMPNGVMAGTAMRGMLRGLTDQNGQPIFKSDMQGPSRYILDGMDTYFPQNGFFDPNRSLAIVGDWNKLVYSIRQDMTFKIFTEGVIQNPATGAIEANLMQNDLIALRAVMRLGWEIANPITAYNAGISDPFPFAVYTPAP